MERWSFVKSILLGSVSFENFVYFGKQFCDIINSRSPGTAQVTISLYKKLPWSVPASENGILEWVAKENEQRLLAEIDGIENVSKELFNLAENVQLLIRHADEFGLMECKGLLPRHIVYAVEPDSLGDLVKYLIKKPSRLTWGVGDGSEELHPHSLS